MSSVTHSIAEQNVQFPSNLTHHSPATYPDIIHTLESFRKLVWILEAPRALTILFQLASMTSIHVWSDTKITDDCLQLFTDITENLGKCLQGDFTSLDHSWKRPRASSWSTVQLIRCACSTDDRRRCDKNTKLARIYSTLSTKHDPWKRPTNNDVQQSLSHGVLQRFPRYCNAKPRQGNWRKPAGGSIKSAVLRRHCAHGRIDQAAT